MELPEWLVQLGDILRQLGQLLAPLFAFLMKLVPVGLWLAFWLWAVNWKKVWPVLAQGAWVPCVLLILIIATAWSRIEPGPYECLGLMTVPNFWWQLGACGAWAALALFAGWLQGYMGWQPPEYSVEPPADHG